MLLSILTRFITTKLRDVAVDPVFVGDNNHSSSLSANVSSCREVYILGYNGPICQISAGYTRIQSIHGLNTALDWTRFPKLHQDISSIRYAGPVATNTSGSGCNTSMFRFRDENASVLGTIFYTPSQANDGCLNFGNGTVISYT